MLRQIGVVSRGKIASREVYAAGTVPGSGAVPYIHTSNLNAVKIRIEAATGNTAPEITREPGIDLPKLKDPVVN